MKETSWAPRLLSSARVRSFSRTTRSSFSPPTGGSAEMDGGAAWGVAPAPGVATGVEGVGEAAVSAVAGDVGGTRAGGLVGKIYCQRIRTASESRTANNNRRLSTELRILSRIRAGRRRRDGTAGSTRPGTLPGRYRAGDHASGETTGRTPNRWG